MSRQGEKRKPSFQNIRSFWENEATEWGDSPMVTIRDHYFRIHELNLLLSLIPRTEALLDVGCGTGFGTLILSQKAEHTLGIDYSGRMIQRANRFSTDKPYRHRLIDGLSPLWGIKPGSNVDFQVADLLDLSLKEARFDTITGQRILINLPTHQDKMIALENLRHQATSNAMLILVEATREGHRKTDEYRERFGLPLLEKYWHNDYVDESRLDQWRQHGWRIEGFLTFDTYMLLSKVVYPAACGPDSCEFLSGANAAAMEMANVFRTKAAVDEIGVSNMLVMFKDRVMKYDEKEGKKIEKWVYDNIDDMPDWSGLGHQKLFVARAC